MTNIDNNIKKLHPMSSFGIVAGLTKEVRVTRLENRLTPAVPFPHKHNFYHLVFITKGSGWHEIDFQRYQVKKGAFFFMLPAQVHSWSMSLNTTGIVIEFENLSMFKGIENNVISEALNPAKNYYLYSRKSFEDIALLCSELLLEYEKELKNFEIMLTINLSKLLIMLSRNAEIKAPKVTGVSKFRDEFTALVEQNFKTHHAPEFYSNALKLTPKSLNAKVNRILGKSVRDLIQERCILESKRLLAYSDLSVTEVALELGYEDPNYFTRFFKLKTKTNPGKFRHKVRHIC